LEAEAYLRDYKKQNVFEGVLKLKESADKLREKFLSL